MGQNSLFFASHIIGVELNKLLICRRHNGQPAWLILVGYTDALRMYAAQIPRKLD